MNKTNLRDLISAIGLVILLKSNQNPYFTECVTLKFDGWPYITTWNIFHAPWSYVCHFIAICKFRLYTWSGNAQIGAKSSNFWLGVLLVTGTWRTPRVRNSSLFTPFERECAPVWCTASLTLPWCGSKKKTTPGMHHCQHTDMDWRLWIFNFCKVCYSQYEYTVSINCFFKEAYI